MEAGVGGHMLDQFETVGEFEMVASSLNGVLGQSELLMGMVWTS